MGVFDFMVFSPFNPWSNQKTLGDPSESLASVSGLSLPLNLPKGASHPGITPPKAPESKKKAPKTGVVPGTLGIGPTAEALTYWQTLAPAEVGIGFSRPGAPSLQHVTHRHTTQSTPLFAGPSQAFYRGQLPEVLLLLDEPVSAQTQPSSETMETLINQFLSDWTTYLAKLHSLGFLLPQPDLLAENNQSTANFMMPWVVLTTLSQVNPPNVFEQQAQQCLEQWQHRIAPLRLNQNQPGLEEALLERVLFAQLIIPEDRFLPLSLNLLRQTPLGGIEALQSVLARYNLAVTGL